MQDTEVDAERDEVFYEGYGFRPRSLRAHWVNCCQRPNAQVIAVSDSAMVLALPSDEKKINGLVKMLKPIGIIEMSRSGQIAVTSPD